MHKSIAVCFFICLACSLTFAQNFSWNWAAQGGGADDDRGNASVTDAQGNKYITGTFNSTATFGSTTLTSSGGFDIFVAKLDCEGNWLWAVKAGGTSHEHSIGIDVDSAGNIFITGYFTDTTLFGSISLVSNGSTDIFAAKLSPEGNWLWAKKAGSGGTDSSSGIAVDNSGNVYLCGTIYGNVSFGNTSLISYGDYDVFVAKLNGSGSWVWAKNAGGISYDHGCGLKVDSESNVYVTGDFYYTANFGSHAITSNSSIDVFLAKIDVNGNWVWVNRAGGNQLDQVGEVAIDNAGYVYWVGGFRSTADFGSTQLVSGGSVDIFIAKLNTEGNWIWAKRAGGAYVELCSSIAIDALSNVYLAGSFVESADFGTTVLTSVGDADIFISKLDSEGNWLWSIRAGGIGQEEACGISLWGNESICITGYFAGAAEFGNIMLNNNGGDDVFVANLTDTVSLADESNSPAVQETIGVYPNPFCSEVAFKISPAGLAPNANNCAVTASVYDLRGRLIKTTRLEGQKPYPQTIVWDGKDAKNNPCPNGMYIVRVTCGNRTLSTKKLCLIRT